MSSDALGQYPDKNVAESLQRLPGIKDGYKMRTFVEEVRRADCTVLE